MTENENNEESLIQIEDDNAVDIVIKVEEEDKDEKSKFKNYKANIFI